MVYGKRFQIKTDKRLEKRIFICKINAVELEPVYISINKTLPEMEIDNTDTRTPELRKLASSYAVRKFDKKDYCTFHRVMNIGKFYEAYQYLIGKKSEISAL